YLVNERTKVDVSVRCGGSVAEDFRLLAPFIRELGDVGKLECGPDVTKPPKAATQVHADFELYVAGVVDEEAERVRLTKLKGEKERSLNGARAKLANPSFVDRAPPEVVQQVRDQVADLEAQLKVIEDTLRELGKG